MAAEDDDSTKPAYAAGESYEPSRQSIWQRFLQGAAKRPHHPAVRAVHQPADHLSDLLDHANGVMNAHHQTTMVPETSPTHLVWSYSQLQHTSERLAAALATHGVGPGSTVLCFLWGGIESALFWWAATRLRACYVPLDPRILQRPEALRNYLEPLKPELLVASSASALRQAEVVAAPVLGGVKIKVVADGDGEQSSWPSLKSLLRGQHDAGTLPDVSAVMAQTPLGSAPCGLMFTSGSSGQPKGCQHTESQWSYVMDHLTGPMMMNQDSVYTQSLPPFRGPAIACSLTAWRNGATVVYSAELPTVSTILDACSQTNTTHLDVSPALVNVLSDHLGSKHLGSSAPRIVMVNGDIHTIDTLQKIQRIFQPELVLPLYGATEGAPVVTCQPHTKRTFLGAVSGVGTVTPGSKIKICTQSTRDICRRGQTGALHVSSPCMVKGYLQGREPESFYVDDEGEWQVTGDQAVIDDAGVLYVIGRFKDVIKSRGLSLSPVLMESIVAAKFKVTAKVVAVPEPTVGTVPVVVIKPSFATPIVDKEKVKETIVQEMGPDASPKEVLMLGDIGLDDFPLNVSNKISKPDLLQILYKHLGVV